MLIDPEQLPLPFLLTFVLFELIFLKGCLQGAAIPNVENPIINNNDKIKIGNFLCMTMRTVNLHLLLSCSVML